MTTSNLGLIKLFRLVDGSFLIGTIDLDSTGGRVSIKDPHELQIAPSQSGQMRLMMVPFGAIPGIYPGRTLLILEANQLLFMEDAVPEPLIHNFIKATSNIEIASADTVSRLVKP